MQPFDSLVPMAFVSDMQASITFYGRLGFEVQDTFTPEGAGAPSWAWLQSGRAHLMIARASHPIVAAEQAILFYLYIDDVDAKHAELKAAGVKVGEMRYEFYATRGEFRVTDPDGHTLMITHTGS